MALLNNIRISVKIALAFMAVCLVILVAGLVNVLAYQHLDSAVQRLESVEAYTQDFETYMVILPTQRQKILTFMLTGERSLLEEVATLEEQGEALRQRLADTRAVELPGDVVQALFNADAAHA